MITVIIMNRILVNFIVFFSLIVTSLSCSEVRQEKREVVKESLLGDSVKVNINNLFNNCNLSKVPFSVIVDSSIIYLHKNKNKFKDTILLNINESLEQLHETQKSDFFYFKKEITNRGKIQGRGLVFDEMIFLHTSVIDKKNKIKKLNVIFMLFKTSESVYLEIVNEKIIFIGLINPDNLYSLLELRKLSSIVLGSAQLKVCEGIVATKPKTDSVFDSRVDLLDYKNENEKFIDSIMLQNLNDIYVNSSKLKTFDIKERYDFFTINFLLPDTIRQFTCRNFYDCDPFLPYE